MCQVPILSDPSTLLDVDVNKAEADLLQRDNCRTDTLSPLHFETPVMSPLGILPVLEPSRPNLSLVKVEGPLTPLNFLPPSSDVAIDIPDCIKGADIDQVLGQQQSELYDAKGKKDPSGVFSDEILDALEEKAKFARRGIEQERLQAADSMARMEIPTLDFSVTSPEWQEASQLARLKESCKSFSVLGWSKNSQAERKLRWCPFPSKTTHISMNESINGDDNVFTMLEFPDLLEVLTSADYVWKEPGLAVLREPDEEEEQLESPIPHEDRNIESLVRKRKFELGNQDSEAEQLSGSPSPVHLIQYPTSITSTSCQTPLDDHSQFPNLLLGCNDPSATSTLLSNYVDFHTAKRQKNSKSTFFPSSTGVATKSEGPATRETVSTGQPKTATAPEVNPVQKPATLAPCPEVKPTLGKTKIIKALTLGRGVFSRLEKLYPNAEIIERDFDRWNTLAWVRNSVSSSPVVSSLAAEADVIVSPATGIVITTLLKAMQRPPPGHKGQSAIRERIRSVALRYERLIVLVSEASGVDEMARDLTPPECVGYADFAGFVAGLDTNTQTYYVGGNDGTLAEWLVSFLTRYAPEAAESQDNLIQDETLWELFLRRAGMNAYAAQVILGQSKTPDNAPEEGSGQCGLTAFVKMTPVERVQNFRGLMCGERVLHRVNEILGTRWG